MFKFKEIIAFTSMVALGSIVACVSIIAKNTVVVTGREMIAINPALKIYPDNIYLFVGQIQVPIGHTTAGALTMGQTVVIFYGVEALEMIAMDRCFLPHENVHSKQYKEHGFFTFFKNYLSFYLKERYVNGKDEYAAYRSIPYEQEAYGVEDGCQSTEGDENE